MGTTDEQLIVLYRRGDPRAMETLIRRYEQPLFAYLLRHVQDQHLAEDLFQETFLKLARVQQDYDPKRPFRPWLYTIAGNLARDALRKKRVRRATSLEESAANGAAEIDQDGPHRDLVRHIEAPGVIAEQNEQAEALAEGVDQLPSDCRKVVHMRFYQGKKYREVAEELNIPVGTVKSRMHAAIRQLGRFWRERFGEDEESSPCPKQETTKS